MYYQSPDTPIYTEGSGTVYKNNIYNYKKRKNINLIIIIIVIIN